MSIESIAHEMTESADDFMRAARVRLTDGSNDSAQRAMIIAVREYEWAARLWRLLGNANYERACLERSESVRANRWVDPTKEDSHG